MTVNPRLLTVVLALPLGACIALDASDVVERSQTRAFTVAPHSTVHVKLKGGSIATDAGPAGRVGVELRARVRASSDREADAVMADYDVSTTQRGNDLWIVARRRSEVNWKIWKLDRVQVSARLTVPADVQLDLDTSGGSITVRGDRAERLKADTSGGGIRVDGGPGDMDLDTSGGSITVGRALGSLKADTSGGGISVQYVGPAVRLVDLDTSGGGIRVGVDPGASLALSAETSGGGVRVEGLPFSGDDVGRSHARGTINGGAGRLRASTSGGGVTIAAARP
jgi:Toastrack DUF4097